MEERRKTNDSSNIFVINKKLATCYLRKLCRIESAKAKERTRQEILDARTSDTRLFHKLISKQRGKVKYCINELSVNGNIYKTEDDILHGWQEHFSNLATPSYDDDFDDQYREQVHREMREIIDLCSKYGNPNDFEHVTESQNPEAIASLNKGKAPDYHGVQVEHLLSCSSVITDNDQS